MLSFSKTFQAFSYYCNPYSLLHIKKVKIIKMKKMKKNEKKYLKSKIKLIFFQAGFATKLQASSTDKTKDSAGRRLGYPDYYFK